MTRRCHSSHLRNACGRMQFQKKTSRQRLKGCIMGIYNNKVLLRPPKVVLERYLVQIVTLNVARHLYKFTRCLKLVCQQQPAFPHSLGPGEAWCSALLTLGVSCWKIFLMLKNLTYFILCLLQEKRKRNKKPSKNVMLC